MTKRVKIAVTAEDICNGKPTLSTGCPIALAVRRRGINATVWEEHIYSNEYDHIKVRPLPRSAQRFIVRFDHDKPVKPFNFFITQDA